MILRKFVKSYAYLMFGFLILFAALSVGAAVSVDSRSSGGAFSNTGVTTLSWTHTVGTGTSRALFVGVSSTSATGLGPVCAALPGGCVALPGSFAPVLSVTYDAVPLTLVSGTSNITSHVSIYQLVGPSTGSGTITVTFEPGVITHAVGSSVSFFGVSPTFATINPTVNAGSSDVPTVFVSGGGMVAGDMVIDALASTPTAGFFSEGVGQTVCTNTLDETTCTRGRRFFFNAYEVGASSNEAGNPAGVTMSWAMTTGQPWVITAAVIKALPPSAANVSIGGRVLTETGSGVARAHVSLTAPTGDTRTVLTNGFGYYRFDNLPAGETYIVTVSSKRYLFQPRVVNADDEVTDLDFIAEPQ